MVVYACNPSTWKAEGSRIQGHLRLHLKKTIPTLLLLSLLVAGLFSFFRENKNHEWKTFSASTSKPTKNDLHLIEGASKLRGQNNCTIGVCGLHEEASVLQSKANLCTCALKSTFPAVSHFNQLSSFPVP
jgi:hypothetical protein